MHLIAINIIYVIYVLFTFSIWIISLLCFILVETAELCHVLFVRKPFNVARGETWQQDKLSVVLSESYVQ